MPRRAANTATVTPTPEDHVRRYLQYLTDPESLRDEAAIKKAHDALAKATDPIDKVRAITAVERAEAVDGDVFREAFLAHVATWVEETAVSTSALSAYGVPDDDLVDAGLLQPAPMRHRRPRAATVKPVKGRRSPRMQPEQVAALMVKGVKYRLADIAQLIDRDPATARNYVMRLIDANVVEDLGDDPDHGGKGKAPHIFRLT